MKEKMAIFDMDGTLFDTIDVNYMSYNEALKRYGKEITREYFKYSCNGKNYKEFLPPIIQDVQAIEQIHEIKKSLYKDFMHNVIENEHLFNIISKIQDHYYIILATTASRKNTEDILTKFGKLQLFDHIITQDEVPNVKPSPEIYIKAMQTFEIAPSNTIIFEDSKQGIEAARKSGATVFVVDNFCK